MEKRHMFFNSELNVRAIEETDKAFIEGYFVVFNQETELFKGAFEEISPRALDNTLKDRDIMCLDNHDTRAVLASTLSETLELKADEHGLFGRVEIDLDDPFSKSAYRKVQTGKVRGCSFGFYPLEEETEVRADGTTKWRITELELLEVSITAFPAYPQTEISARQKDIESLKKERFESRKKQLKERLLNE